MRIVLAVLVFTATADAGDRHEIAIGTSNRALRTSSANAVTSDSLTGGALGYAHHLPIELMPRLQVWGEASFTWGSVGGTMFQTLTTEVDTLAILAGARARYALHRRVGVIGRLDVGSARAAFALRDTSGHSASDAGWGGTSAAALGIDLLAVKTSRLALGVRFELGYTATTSIPLVATPDDDMQTLELEMTAAGLGSLNLSGRMFIASVVSQF
jgi:hypothetical protein